MNKIVRGCLMSVLSLVLLAAAAGCQGRSGKEGVYVMFEGNPGIYHNEVYYRGRIVGTIQNKEIKNGTTGRIAIKIDPDYRQYAGQHWAFYVDHGRLIADRLNSSGKSIQPGDTMCGFSSKSAFTWFKVKTLLGNRVLKAHRRAEKLNRRFVNSG